jgi:hypothetical protein
MCGHVHRAEARHGVGHHRGRMLSCAACDARDFCFIFAQKWTLGLVVCESRGGTVCCRARVWMNEVTQSSDGTRSVAYAHVRKLLTVKGLQK